LPFFHGAIHAAALDHEAVDHAVEDQAVMTAFHVFEKVGDGLGRLFGIEFQHDVAGAGLQFDHGVGGCGDKGIGGQGDCKKGFFHGGPVRKRFRAQAKPS
jgi:hypothetical protein